PRDIRTAERLANALLAPVVPGSIDHAISAGESELHGPRGVLRQLPGSEPEQRHAPTRVERYRGLLVHRILPYLGVFSSLLRRCRTDRSHRCRCPSGATAGAAPTCRG